MKGIVLAGGLGSRLLPLTKITNKHLLPVYNEPMVYFPIRTLVEAGIRDILLVTGGYNAGDFLRLLGNGEAFGLRQLNYAYQSGEGGIADALRLAEPFADGSPICVVLGDNIIENSISGAVQQFRSQGEGAHILLKEVHDPSRFGVPAFQNGRITRIEEKPANPASPYAVIGVYFYDSSVFQRIHILRPSSRGELEITDLNNSYLAEGKLSHIILDGYRKDAGTFESLLVATNLVAESVQKKQAAEENSAKSAGVLAGS
jgi:glucose-1-phosphate thymidylyltransferase